MNGTADHAPPRVTRDDHDDSLDALGDRIAVLAAHIHAATYELLRLVGNFDRLHGWESGGHRSCAHWLAFRTGVDLGAAREKVRTARALADLPATSASMARGELSFSKVRALTSAATPESEGDLLELARGCTVAQLERIVRAWKRHSRADEADLEGERHERRARGLPRRRRDVRREGPPRRRDRRAPDASPGGRERRALPRGRGARTRVGRGSPPRRGAAPCGRDRAACRARAGERIRPGGRGPRERHTRRALSGRVARRRRHLEPGRRARAERPGRRHSRFS